MDLGEHYLENALFTLRYYKTLGERAIEQVSDTQLHWTPDPEANSIAIVVKHMSGNMRSRWTDFLTSDGEKADRNRDGEFIDDLGSRADLLRLWERGWRQVFDAITALTAADLTSTVTIRNREHTVAQAIDRQVAHYAYHVGQIVYLARMLAKESWQSLSIPRGQSGSYEPRGRI
ncbi:MAG: DUF1572 family protein [Planctomycetota bacterium]|jgi:uncharacterized damage-inducible protein DinB